MRLFVALEISAAVRGHLAGLIEELRALEPVSSAKKVRWARSENLHVTLKFIGETAPEKLEAIGAALSAVHSAQAVELRFRGLGFFPNEKRARVFFAGIEATPNLAAIAGDVDQHLGKVGFPRESRPLFPHLTLARFEPPGIARELHVAVQGKAAREFGVLHTKEFHLIESKLKPSGAEYTTLRSFPFAAEA